MVQILYTQDHAARGQALAGAIGPSHNGLVTTKPITKTGLTGLLFWGHGDSSKMCEMSATAMVKLITEWKKLNPKLETVELVTCNARHATGKKDSFATQVKSGLHGFLSSTRNIVVKALPVAVKGAHNAFSILLVEPKSNSWVYVTGPGVTDKTMFEGANLITSHDVVGGDGKTKKVSYKGDIAMRANSVLMDKANLSREWTMNYGYLSTLRASLGVV